MVRATPKRGAGLAVTRRAPPRAADLVVIGAGPAGLAAAVTADRLGASVLVLEAAEEPGGLTRSFRVDGYTFDVCGHVLHLSNPEARSLIDSVTVPGDWVGISRRSAVWIRDRLVPYPFQLHLRHAPPDVREDCLATLPQDRPDLGVDPARVPLLKWLESTLGSGLGRHFMVPYNEKLATVPVSELTCEWLGRFVPPATPDQVREGADSSRTLGVGYNRCFLYPSRGGIDLIPRALSMVGPAVQTGARVRSVDTRRRLVTLATGERVAYREALISSAPLPETCRMVTPRSAAIDAAAALLRANQVTCVNLGLRRIAPAFSETHWIYLPERRFRSYRVGFYDNFAEAMSPPGRKAVYVEIAHGAQARERELVAHAISDLVELGAIADASEVDVAAPVHIPVGYVIPDRTCAPIRARAHRELAARGVHMVGRYGRWEYSSIEDALVQGIEAAHELLSEPQYVG
jgi:protoporphyrinogen oxidase